MVRVIRFVLHENSDDDETRVALSSHGLYWNLYKDQKLSIPRVVARRPLRKSKCSSRDPKVTAEVVWDANGWEARDNVTSYVEVIH